MYASAADNYDDIVITTDSHLRLKRLLKLALSLTRRLKEPGERLRAIDICGGTGNASFLLDDQDCMVEMIDISMAMIDRFKKRCQSEQRKINARCVDAVDFLQSVLARPEEKREKYDIIVFSSALHHFRFPEAILTQAFDLLQPGGIIVAAADPTLMIRSKCFRLGSLVDRLLRLLLHDPRAAVSKAAEKGRSLLSFLKAQDRQREISLGAIAEYHAQTGIDDRRLVSSVEAAGGYVVLHQRYSAGYTVIFQILYRVFRCETSFCLLVSNTYYSHAVELKND